MVQKEQPKTIRNTLNKERIRKQHMVASQAKCKTHCTLLKQLALLTDDFRVTRSTNKKQNDQHPRTQQRFPIFQKRSYEAPSMKSERMHVYRHTTDISRYFKCTKCFKLRELHARYVKIIQDPYCKTSKLKCVRNETCVRRTALQRRENCNLCHPEQ